MIKVTLDKLHKSFEIKEGESLLSLLKREGFDIKSSCGGCASCGDCVIEIVSGENNLNEISFEEKTLLGNVFHITKERLSCQTQIFGPVTININKHLDKKDERFNRPKLRKKAEKIALDAESKSEEYSEKEARDSGFNRPQRFDYSDEDETKE